MLEENYINYKYLFICFVKSFMINIYDVLKLSLFIVN